MRDVLGIPDSRQDPPSGQADIARELIAGRTGE
jgi:hypothetical protein